MSQAELLIESMTVAITAFPKKDQLREAIAGLEMPDNS
jgi:hypothetical protein